jgi:3-phosphoshikimate 1-carboxyvinyltransferase
MIATIKPSIIHGEAKAPPSKSMMQRACALALLNKGETIIYNYGKSNDDLIALDIIAKLGAQINRYVDHIVIQSNGEINPTENINCNESGLSLRMFTPIIAISDKSVCITGNGTILKRPIGILAEIFKHLEVEFISNNGR